MSRRPDWAPSGALPWLIGAPILLGLPVGLSAGCGGGEQEAAPAPAVPLAGVTPRTVRDVVGSTLLRLGAVARVGELSAPELRNNEGLLLDEAPGDDTEPSAGAGAEAPAIDSDLIEMRDGLIGMVMGDPRQLGLARKDIEHQAGEIEPALILGLQDTERAPNEMKALIDLAVAAKDAGVAAAVARVAAEHPEPWLRRYAAWALAAYVDADGSDRVVSGLVRRLKYERDPETLVWTCKTLADFGNYAGVKGLYDMTVRPAGDAAGDAARAQLGVVLQAQSQTQRDPLNTEGLLAAWSEGQLGRTSEQATDAARGELWVLVADLSGEHFQLRGVDDARYILSRLGPWAATELALALEDDDEYVRLHVAQVLGRMGPRGQGAYESCVAALTDPHAAVAGVAAETLVEITRGTALAPDAKAALEARLDAQCPYELRIACLRALGALDARLLPMDRLTGAFEGQALSDLRLAVAPGLLAGGRADLALPWLISELTAKVGDPAGAESLLEGWLESRAGAGPSGAGSSGAAPEETPAALALDAWRSFAPKEAIVHGAEEAKARRASRRAALEPMLPSLKAR